MAVPTPNGPSLPASQMPIPVRRGTFLSTGRGSVWSMLLMGAVAAAAILVYRETTANLSERGIATGFDFLVREAGFAIGEVAPVPVPSGPGAALFAALVVAAVISGIVQRHSTVGAAAAAARLVLPICLAACLIVLVRRGVEFEFIEYAPHHTFGFALVTGFANTVKVSAVGIVLASVVGLLVGLGRLSTNLLVRSVCAVYVETLRNVPLLIQVFFWYFGVLRTLPSVRDSVDVFGVAALNNRGIFLPRPDATAGLAWHAAALAATTAIYFLLRRRADRQQQVIGRRPPVAFPVLAIAVTLGALAWFKGGVPLEWSYPTRVGFNFRGGVTLTPEFAALLLGISFYTAAFIAEIVRSGVQGVGRGQWEAARSLGLSEGPILRLIVLPQAMRVIFPPLISQYLSLVKDSSLGIAIAYPEIVSISNTMINQTGQPIEILAITITVFMVMNLLISALINWYNEARPWVAS